MIAVLANLAFVLLVLGLYWLPSIVVCLRRHPDLFTVVVVNALLGWTVIGWIIALGKAIRPVTPPVTAGSYRSDYRPVSLSPAIDDL